MDKLVCPCLPDGQDRRESTLKRVWAWHPKPAIWARRFTVLAWSRYYARFSSSVALCVLCGEQSFAGSEFVAYRLRPPAFLCRLAAVLCFVARGWAGLALVCPFPPLRPCVSA